MAEAQTFGLRIELETIGAATSAATFSRMARIGRTGRGLAAPLWNMFMGPQKAADALHICVSGGLSFWRGLVLAAAARQQRKRTLVHLHSRLATCHREALQLAQYLARSPYITFVTPCREDALSKPFFQLVNHFISDHFSAGHKWPGPSRSILLRLVYLGWMIREKGIFDLLTALRSTPQVTVDFIGPNVRASDLAKFKDHVEAAQMQQRVRYLGCIDHAFVPRTMCQYDALIFPSQGESFGLTPAEAMHLGVPVIATRVGYLRDAPTDTFIELADKRTWAQTLNDVCQQRDTLLPCYSQRARQFAADFLSANAVMPRWRMLYSAPH